MKIQIITLFPEMFEGVFDHSMLLKATKIKAVGIELINLRDFGIGPRKQVDDTPYGGGDGMVLKPEPLFEAVNQAKHKNSSAKVILFTPRGERIKQQRVRQLAKNNQNLILICGRYEGYDERITSLVDLELSVGDFVLTGGEIPAMILTDAITRLLPGVLGGETSAEIESFRLADEVEYPQYTRPAEYNGLKVPEVLLSGNHAQIQTWRNQQSQTQSQKLKDQLS